MVGEGDEVTLGNYDRPPHVQWAFLHMRQIAPTALVRAGGEARPFERAERDLEGLEFEHEGASYTIAQMMDETCVDGLLLVQDGKIVFERYRGQMTPTSLHLLQSVSKTLTASLAGVVIEQGRLTPETEVPDIIPELAGTCWDGCTIQHLLDMRSGTAFDESDYEDENSESYRGFRALGWLPRRADDPSPTDYIAQMRNDKEHGSDFEYRSICTDVLGWCLERAAGEPLAELFSREIWMPMGAELDADFMLGPGGFPLTSGGFCVSARDLARFGQMWLDGGEVGGQQVIPRAWTERVRVADSELIQAFASSPEAKGASPTAFYHDQWWVDDAEAGIYSGYGIHGQQVLVHHPTRSVVVRLSSWPRPWVDSHSTLADAAALALCQTP